MSGFISKLKQEIINAIPAIIYFCIAFNLINFTEGLYYTAGYLNSYSYLAVTMGALVAGKVLIIVNTFPFINAFPNKPLIYNIAWKSLIYSVAVLLVRVLEDYIHIAWQYDNVRSAYQLVKTKLTLAPFWGTQMWLTLIFFVFVVFSEFTRVIGKDKIKLILLGSPHSLRT